MRRKIFGLFGISGVGKSWMANHIIIKYPRMLHLVGSELIKKVNEKTVVSSESLRKKKPADISNNQDLLINMFHLAIAAKPDVNVIFDGHTVIDTHEGYIVIAFDIIKQLDLAEIIYITDEDQTILHRRELDESRQRPKRSLLQIKDYQDLSRQTCQKYAALLGIPIQIVKSGDIDALFSIIKG